MVGVPLAAALHGRYRPGVIWMGLCEGLCSSALAVLAGLAPNLTSVPVCNRALAGWLWRCVGGSGGGVEPLDEEEVDFSLVVEDEVDEVAGVVGSEGPPSDGAGGVVFVVGLAVPRGEFEGGQDLGEVGECVGGQRGDLVRHRGVGNDAIHP